MKKLIVFFGWFVVTYAGQPVAGPFDDVNVCQRVAWAWYLISQGTHNTTMGAGVNLVCQWWD